MNTNRINTKPKWMRLKVFCAFIVALMSLFASIIAIIQYIDSRIIIDVTGWWKFEFTVQSTTYKEYKGERYGYRIYLHQKDSDIIGEGEEWWFNGYVLPYPEHSPIKLTGDIKDKQINMSYELKGKLRDTIGSIHFSFDRDQSQFVGRFKGTAADASGIVTAVRLD